MLQTRALLSVLKPDTDGHFSIAFEKWAAARMSEANDAIVNLFPSSVGKVITGYISYCKHEFAIALFQPAAVADWKMDRTIVSWYDEIYVLDRTSRHTLLQVLISVGRLDNIADLALYLEPDRNRIHLGKLAVVLAMIVKSRIRTLFAAADMEPIF